MTTKFAAFFFLDFPYSATTSRFLLFAFGESLIVALATPSVTPLTPVSLGRAFAFDLEPLIPADILVARGLAFLGLLRQTFRGGLSICNNVIGAWTCKRVRFSKRLPSCIG